MMFLNPGTFLGLVIRLEHVWEKTSINPFGEPRGERCAVCGITRIGRFYCAGGTWQRIAPLCRFAKPYSN